LARKRNQRLDSFAQARTGGIAMPQANSTVQASITHAREYPGLQHISVAADRVIAVLAASLKKDAA
jgi:hypothetical protein